MANLFQALEATAARGAAGLAADARETLSQALRALQDPAGGFAGLDGRPDPYYTFFAWLSLRALGAAYDRGRVCAYMAAHRQDANRIDAQCAALVLVREGQRPCVPWLKGLVALVRGDTRGLYGVFLLALALGEVSRPVARLAWWRQRRLFAADQAARLPTSRLAAGVVLSALAGARGADLLSVLSARRCSGGGFASAAGAAPDLLATAVARFACGGGTRSSRTREDLAFIEACWLEDGLFGASPRALRGDAEHTFYALLALGTCRPFDAGFVHPDLPRRASSAGSARTGWTFSAR